MAAVGLSTPLLDHTRRAVNFAVDLKGGVARLGAVRELDLDVVIGIAAGSVVTDVVHEKEVLFQLWGDAVIQADHARDQAAPGQIVVTQRIKEQLADNFTFTGLEGAGRHDLWILTEA